MGLKLLKLTATELSERAGITRRTLRNIENGEADSEISRDRAGSYAEQAIATDAQGYVLKGDPDELPHAIRQIMQGERYISKALQY